MPVLTKINSNVIADDAITGDMLGSSAYLANTATQNISGTYSESRMYTSDAYTLSGNATINSNLILSTVKPNTNVVLTAGGAYTLTGTGVLSGGSLLAPQRNDLTNMTGELGSTVTGAPALNLGVTTLPSGSIIQAVGKVSTTQFSNTGGWHDTGITMEITPKMDNSHIHLTGILVVCMTNSSASGGGSFKWRKTSKHNSYQRLRFPDQLISWDGSGTETYNDHWNQASWTAAEFNWKQPISGIDTTGHLVSDGEITYELQSITYSMDGWVLGHGYESNSFFQAYEIVP